jgi:hypothetical protein
VFDNAPCHTQQQYAGKTLSWCSSDSEQEYAKNVADKNQYIKLDLNGWANQHPRVTALSYQFNSAGFRSREIDPAAPGFAVFGCSFTVGIGLPEYELYHYYLGKKLKLPVDNFGILGASNGLSFRVAQYWLSVAKPKFVILQTTFKERFEIINQYDVSTVMSPQFDEATTQEVFRNWWFTDANSIADRDRNALAIRYLCHQLDIPIFVIDVEDFRNPVDGLARDLTHSGPRNHQQVAELLYDQIHAHPRFSILKCLLPGE